MNFLKRFFILKFGNFLSRQISIDEQKLILQMLEENKKANLLDLGCHDGVRTSGFTNKVNPSKTYGLDMTQAIKKAKRNYGIIVKRSDLNKKFPVPSNSMDVVVTAHTIEHLTDTDTFLQEIHRVLKPNGYLVVSTDNLASWFNIFSLVLGRQPTAGPTISTRYLVTLSPLWWEEGAGGVSDVNFPMHHNVMTTKTLEILLTRYGFKVEKVLGSGYPPVPYPIARLFTTLDVYHSMFMVIKARKK